MTVDPELSAAIHGDRNARETLVVAHGPRVFGMCRRLDPEPDDAYQEVWTKIFRGLARFDPSGSAPLAAWIATVTRRHLIDRHRRRGARGEVVELHELPTQDPTSIRLAERAQLRDHLETALQALPIEQRMVVVQHHLFDCDLATLAADTGVAVGTLKSRLHRGRARLAKLLRRHA
jgi:RNA polymerase sigma-70 factor (ECF subfamily)